MLFTLKQNIPVYISESHIFVTKSAITLIYWHNRTSRSTYFTKKIQKKMQIDRTFDTLFLNIHNICLFPVQSYLLGAFGDTDKQPE